MSIKFTDVCFITTDVLRLRAFYEAVFGGKAEGDEIHSGLAVDGMFFAFDHADTLQKNPAFQYVSAVGANNVIIGINVEDADLEYKRISTLDAEMLNQPTTHQWGARSFQFKDPDGNILNFRSFPKEEKSC